MLWLKPYFPELRHTIYHVTIKHNKDFKTISLGDKVEWKCKRTFPITRVIGFLCFSWLKELAWLAIRYCNYLHDLEAASSSSFQDDENIFQQRTSPIHSFKGVNICGWNTSVSGVRGGLYNVVARFRLYWYRWRGTTMAVQEHVWSITAGLCSRTHQNSVYASWFGDVEMRFTITDNKRNIRLGCKKTHIITEIMDK